MQNSLMILSQCRLIIFCYVKFISLFLKLLCLLNIILWSPLFRYLFFSLNLYFAEFIVQSCNINNITINIIIIINIKIIGSTFLYSLFLHLIQISIQQYDQQTIKQLNYFIIQTTFKIFIYIFFRTMLRKAGLKQLEKYLNSSSQVLMRADFNVPVKEGKIKDVNRIQATIPTINQILKHNPKSLVMLSHLGRPDGHKDPKASLKIVADQLSKKLGRKVTFLDDCIGDNIVETVNKANNEVFLCENVRFHPQQQGKYIDQSGKKIKCTPEAIKKFREGLSKLGNIYVNDAFGTAHRAHSSVSGIAHKIRVAGLLMEKQIQHLGSFLQNPKKPVLVVLGGSKVTDKLQLVSNMINIADEIIIGGGMGYPFLQEVFGYKLGITRVLLPQNPKLLHQVVQKAKSKGVKMHFAVDCIAARQMKADSPTKTFQFAKGLDSDFQSFDIGPQTRQNFANVIKRANSIFWNGPVGVFQIPQFRNGSEAVMRSIISRTKQGAQSIVGGGDSVSLINTFKTGSDFTFISTGGGASVQLMQGNKMPGIDSLSNKDELQ